MNRDHRFFICIAFGSRFLH